MVLKNINILMCLVIAHSGIGHSYILAEDGLNRTFEFLDYDLNFVGAIKGAAVLADPIEACSNISAPPQIDDGLNWFAVIKEGRCSATQKALRAYQAGYSAAIIYLLETPNYLTLNELRVLALRLSVQSNVSFPNLTVVVISGFAAERIKEKFLFSVNPVSRLTISHSFYGVFSFLIFLVAVAIIFICTLLLIWILRCVQRSQRNRNDRLTARHLRKLQTTKFRQGDPYDTCAICLEDFKEKDKLRILPCAHAYHCKCVDPWLLNNQRTCPVCKQKISLPGDTAENTVERTPLLRNRERHPSSHGTFHSGENVPANVQVPPFINHSWTMEVTSRDVLSEILNGTSCEEGHILIKGGCSAPHVLRFAHKENEPVISEPQEHCDPDEDIAGCSSISEPIVASNVALINGARPEQSSNFKPYVV